jgi:toxin ParE1/3/4
MMRLVWREDALDDLDRIVLYIGRHNLDAGFRMQALIEASAERLAEHPYMFRTGRLPGTREAVVHPNYILVYRVGADTVEIVNVLHTRRQYPPASPE